MNYIDNWFHFYETTVSFEVHRERGLINPDSICFLKETGQIYTQNSFFGICRERFEKLEKLVLEHDAKIKNILGIEGPSVNDGIINNIADLVDFLDGFTDQDNLKDFLNSMRNALEAQINEVNKVLSERLTALEDNIKNDSDELNAAIDSINSKIDTINIRLDAHDVSISTLSTALTSHVREYNLLKTNYENFKSYATTKFSSIDSSISSLTTSLNTLQKRFIELDDKFDEVEDNVSEVEALLEESKKLVQKVEDRFGETLADLEQFKKDINNRIDDFKDTIGAPRGIAPLDDFIKVPSEYLPSYVDDVLEYATKAAFPITGEAGKIYVALDDNLTYRWSGSAYIEISKSLALGETSSTAYAGNKGKATADALAAHKADYNNPHKVTKVQLGLDKVNNTADIDKPISTAVQQALDDKVNREDGKGLISTQDVEKITELISKSDQVNDGLQAEIDRATAAEATINNNINSHKNSINNPHGVTKTQIGLGNVDNTSDADKPLSKAANEAFQAFSSQMGNHISDKNNPHKVTAAQLGLGNVDNTADNKKPISEATQAALDKKVDKVANKGLSTNDFTNELKNKLSTAPIFISMQSLPTAAPANSSTITYIVEDKKYVYWDGSSWKDFGTSQDDIDVLLDTKVDKVANKSLISDTLISKIENTMSVVRKTQAEYDALATKDSSTLYIVT